MKGGSKSDNRVIHGGRINQSPLINDLAYKEQTTLQHYQKEIRNILDVPSCQMQKSCLNAHTSNIYNCMHYQNCTQYKDFLLKL